MGLHRHHLDRARLSRETTPEDDFHEQRLLSWGLLDALIAGVVALGAIAVELRLLRKAITGPKSNRTVALHLTGALVPKEGNPPMPAGPFTPDHTQDVQFRISPVNAAGQPTTGPFAWSVSDGSAGSLAIAPDTLSAKLVTPTDPAAFFSAVVTVSDPRSGVNDSALVSRSAPDNNSVSLGLVGELVPKA